MFQYSKKRVHKDVPAWDIFYGDKRCGLLTAFPLDGPTATIKVEQNVKSDMKAIVERTIDASTVNMCFDRATELHQEMIEHIVMELYS